MGQKVQSNLSWIVSFSCGLVTIMCSNIHNIKLGTLPKHTVGNIHSLISIAHTIQSVANEDREM